MPDNRKRLEVEIDSGAAQAPCKAPRTFFVRVANAMNGEGWCRWVLCRLDLNDAFFDEVLSWRTPRSCVLSRFCMGPGSFTAVTALLRSERELFVVDSVSPTTRGFDAELRRSARVSAALRRDRCDCSVSLR